jgi:hypothetical protein
LVTKNMSRPSASPALDTPHFTCPHCGVDANQIWHDSRIPYNGEQDTALRRSDCVSCSGNGYWVHDHLVWPFPLVGDPPSEDLDGDLHDLYEEARRVAPHSPRAAAALLRLLVDWLVGELGEESGTLGARIGRLNQAGDISRRTVTHWIPFDSPETRQIDPAGGDDIRVVNLLFTTVNMIVEGSRRRCSPPHGRFCTILR